MNDTWDEEKTFIIPGAESTAWSIEIRQSNEAYWYIQCPEAECMQIHPRVVTKYWQKENREDGGFEAHVVEVHCFQCDTTGRHFKISAHSPFDILGLIPIPVLRTKTDMEDDAVSNTSFE